MNNHLVYIQEYILDFTKDRHSGYSCIEHKLLGDKLIFTRTLMITPQLRSLCPDGDINKIEGTYI